jgi:D-lyxose ketol-isomerase
MKRSEINEVIDQAIIFFKSMKFSLPEYAFWTPKKWKLKGSEYDEIRDIGLGWDVTDFGSGDFREFGRTIFTLRNGKGPGTQYPKTYAHKVMHMHEGQKSIIHCHKQKMEDIINHGGGIILIAFWKMSADGKTSQKPLKLTVSGRKIIHPAGNPFPLKPGDSICVIPGTYHQFWAEEKHGDVLSMEVSSVCDDLTDNIFLNPAMRFPEITEDEPSRHVLCREYSNFLS